MPGTVFVDESKRSGFRFAVVLVPGREAARARATMRAQLVRGTRRLHFVHENDVNRRRALTAVAALDLRIAIIESSRFETQSLQREAALRWLHIDGPSTAARVLERLELAGEVSAGTLAQAIARYRLLDVRAGASGSTGGDA